MPSNIMTPSAASITNCSSPKDSTGWDGKLRVEKRAVLANPEALSDPEYSNEDAPPVEHIDADEGRLKYTHSFYNTKGCN